MSLPLVLAGEGRGYALFFACLAQRLIPVLCDVNSKEEP